MPYFISARGKKFCVVKGTKGNDQGVVPGGCHPTRAQAVDHMQALYKNVPDARTASAVSGDIHSTGMMVALYVPMSIASGIAVPNGNAPEDMHLTLAYMGKTNEEPVTPEVVDKVHSALSSLALNHAPLTGTIGGLGHFPPGEDGTPVWVPADVVGLDKLRVDVVDALAQAGLPAYTDHGFAPHITLTYAKKGDKIPSPVEPVKASFSEMALKIGSEQRNIPLGNPAIRPSSVAVPESESPAPDTSYAYVRFFFAEGEQSADGRIIDPHSVNFNRQPPLPIRLQATSPESGGHSLSTVCGVVTALARDGNILIGDGVIDTRIDAGQLAVQMASPGPNGESPILQTWSPDLGDVVIDAETNATDEDGTTSNDVVMHVVEGTLLGFTIVALPALGGAVFELCDASGNPITPAPTRSGNPPAPSLQPVHITPVDAPVMSTPPAANLTANLTACASHDHPPSSFFSEPSADELVRGTTITSDGRVFGLVAVRDECHIGYGDRCITIDDIADGLDPDCNFEYALPGGHVVTAEGSKVYTAPFAIKGGHADKSLPWKSALAHYDDPTAALADVVYGRTATGDIYFTGAVRPTATDDQVRIARSSPVSLDARGINGKLRFLATCAVNTPGFPKVSVRFAASAADADPEVLALIASTSEPILFDDDDCGCNDTEKLHEQVAHLTSVIAHSGLESAAFDKLTDEIFVTLERRVS